MELHGNGFTIRGWRKGDEVFLQKHADNTKISRYLLDRFPSPYTIEDAAWWVERLIDQPEPLVNFAITIDDKVIGGIGLEPREDVYSNTALLGYWLSEDLWGKGIITQAVKLITKYAFENLDFIRIQAGVLSKNPASMRVLEKAGYVKEGVCRNAVVKNGEVMDEHVYAIIK